MASEKDKLILAFLAMLVIGSGVYALYDRQLAPEDGELIDTQLCMQDAKLCPDGSYVGREGPNCEFKKCPNK